MILICSRCAQESSEMSSALFYKLVKDIKSLCEKEKEKVKLIKLYSTGEPLLHPQVGEMLKELKTSDICQQVEITTNASLLTEELSRCMVDNELDYFRASI